MTSSSEELFELRRERLRIDHVRLARDDPTFRLRDARGDRDCRFLEEVTSAAPVIVVAVKCFASFEASGAFSARSDGGGASLGLAVQCDGGPQAVMSSGNHLVDCGTVPSKDDRAVLRHHFAGCCVRSHVPQEQVCERRGERRLANLPTN